VKEKIVDNSTNNDESEEDNETEETDSFTDEEQDSTKVKEICRAYVYFCTNFGDSVSKGL